LDTEVSRKLKDIEKQEDIKGKNQLLLHEVEVSQRFKKSASKGVSEEFKAEYEKVFNAAGEELESLINDLMADL